MDDGAAVVPALLFVSFLGSVSFGQLFLCWPLLAEQLGFGKAGSGQIGGLYQGSYAVMLVLSRWFNPPLRPGLRIVIANAAMAVICLFMARTADFSILRLEAALMGLLSVWLWPPLMGRISSGAEGSVLSRRLGRFNAAWSIGLIAGPALGGYLYRYSPVVAFTACALYHGACALAAYVCVRPGREGVKRTAERKNSTARAHPFAGSSRELNANDGPAQNATDPERRGFEKEPILARVETRSAGESGEGAPRPEPADRIHPLRGFARVGLIAAYFVFGMLRFVTPVHAKGMGLGDATIGWIESGLSLSTTAGFLLLGATIFWHEKRIIIIGAMAALAPALWILSLSHGAGPLAIGHMLGGFFISILYSAHLYYGVSGSSDRTARMTTHELLLSIGFFSGALGGGQIAELIGARWFFAVTSAALLLIAILLWMKRPVIDHAVC